MKLAVTTLVLGFIAAGSFAQQAVPEPEYVNEAYFLNGGKLEKAESATLKFRSKTSNYFVEMKATSSQVAARIPLAREGAARRPLQLVPLRFLDVVPATVVRMHPLKVGKDDEEDLWETLNWHLFRRIQIVIHREKTTQFP